MTDQRISKMAMAGWLPIATAPKKPAEVVDLWAKRWNPTTDKFAGRRFPAHYWLEDHKCWVRYDADSQLGIMGYAIEVPPSGRLNESRPRDRIPDGWHVTHWIVPPSPPDGWE